MISRSIHSSAGGEAGAAYWALQLTGWGFYFWGQASGEVIFASVPWHKSATLWGGICLAGITLTHTVRWVSKRQAWLALPPRALLVRVVASVLVLTFLTYAVTVTLSLAVYGSPVAPMLQAFYLKLTLGAQLLNQFIGILIVFLTWIAVYFGFAMQRHRYHAELRQSQLSEALQAAELRLLKSQLNPHFLFNALNGVRALIADDAARAQEAVTQLARTLRYTLASGNEELVTIARELEMVDDYLALESLRLAERLHVVRDIEPEAAAMRIPVMLLQTLVENAIKHGIAPLRQGGALRVTARVSNRELVVEVTNPRPAGVATSAPEGIGLKNAAERLRLLFGPAASLAVDLADAHQVTATVRLPL
jgi:sensor histidine kinase YesM